MAAYRAMELSDAAAQRLSKVLARIGRAYADAITRSSAQLKAASSAMTNARETPLAHFAKALRECEISSGQAPDFQPLLKEVEEARAERTKHLSSQLAGAIEGMRAAIHRHEDPLHAMGERIAEAAKSCRRPEEFEELILERLERLARLKERKKAPTRGMEEQLRTLFGRDLLGYLEADRAAKMQVVDVFDALAKRGRRGEAANSALIAFALDLYARDRIDGDPEQMASTKDLYRFLQREIRAGRRLLLGRAKLWKQATWRTYVGRAQRSLRGA